MPIPLIPLALIGAKVAIAGVVYDRYRKRREDMPVTPVHPEKAEEEDEGARD